jgi:dipeptidase E
MKLFLYSGFSENNPLDAKLTETLQTVPNSTLTIFPSNADDFKGKYFYIIVDYFKKCGFKSINICLYSQTSDQQKISIPANPDFKFISVDEAFKSSAIFLTGGNTYYFLNSLKQNNLILPLQNFARKDGILIGMSAGSMMMSKDITNAKLPSYDPDINEVGLSDLRSLDLSKIYFQPHYDGDERLLNELIDFSVTSNSTIYLCDNSSGIYINNDEKLSYGKITVIESGMTTS